MRRNTVRRRLLGRFIRAGEGDRGIAATLVAIMMPLLFGMCALAIDTGHWYATVQSVQRAADAAALAGVPYLPGDLASAKAQALKTAAANGYSNGGTTVVDPEPVAGQPNQLEVTITTTVDNSFGGLIGVPTTTITRTGTSTYQSPLPMGSPCNEFGNGPDPRTGATNLRSTNCSSAGAFWANVGSPKAAKSYGDAYQDGTCTSGTDNCSGSTNNDYSTSGYFYQVTVAHPVTNLTIQAFDPAFVSVGDLCSSNFGSGTTAASLAKNQYNYNPSTSAAKASYLEDSNLYASGQSNSYCTGDVLYGDSPPDTTFTIRAPTATSNPADPTTYAVVGGCTQTFKGYSGSLYTALNQYKQNSSGVVQYTGTTPQSAGSGYNATVASEFRQWVTLCTIPGTVSAGTYLIQVQTNAADDTTNGNGHNRFALRAYGSGSGDVNSIEITGLTNMAIYANLPSAHTSFYLTQVSPAAAGQVLSVRLFDIGDSTTSGTVRIVPPAESNLSSFSGCTASGPTSGSISNCTITASSSYNGKWETISVPIPANYTCNSSVQTGCWITLSYDYGSGQPSDTTSWQASLDGSPVRLIPNT